MNRSKKYPSPPKEFGPGRDGKWLVACSHWSKPKIVRAKTAAEAARECGVMLSECDQVRPYYEEGTKTEEPHD